MVVEQAKRKPTKYLKRSGESNILGGGDVNGNECEGEEKIKRGKVLL